MRFPRFSSALFSLLPCTLLALVNPEAPRIPARTFNVAEFGAKAGTADDDTAKIQAALDAANKAGGGIVELPKGEYLSGPLRLYNNINLRLAEGALLRMLPRSQYPGGSVNPENFLGGANFHDVAITGKGTIDGQGAPWWPLGKSKEKDNKRPRMITFGGSQRILIEGVTLVNSPMFHIAIGGNSSDIIVRGVTIRAPASNDPVEPSHNTDACDVSGHNILIENCDVSVGDDNFTCGGGTHDVLIRNCIYGNGHGVSIGSGTKGGVHDVTVTHCKFTNTEAGIRIKTDRDRGGHVYNMVYSDLEMTNVGLPIQVYASYMAKDRQYRDLTKITPAIVASYPAEPVGKFTPYFSEIVFRNITATAAPGKRAGILWGLPEMKANNILLENVNINADKPFGIFNARNVRIVNSRITTPEGVNKLATEDAEVELQP